MVAVVALAGGALTMTQLVGQQTSSDCARVLVLTSRGSGQVNVDDPEVAEFAAEVTNRLGEHQVEVRRNPYNAVGVLPSFLRLVSRNPLQQLRAAADAVNGLGAITKLPGIGAYHDSVEDGKEWLRDEIRTVVADCGARTEILLVGYSQGAQVAADVYQRDLTSQEWDQVAGVALFGDPYFNPADGVVGRSTYSRSRSGLLGRRSRFGAPSGRVLSYCHAHDPICQGAFSGLLPVPRLDPLALRPVGSSHTNYADAKGGSGEPREAATIFVEQILAADSSGAFDAPLIEIPDPEAPGATPVVMVVDTSGSMAEEDGTGTVKLEGAKQAILGFLRTVEPDSPIGLRTYPHAAGGNCGPGVQRFPVQRRNPTSMAATVRVLQADGDTPTAEAMEAGVADLRRAGYRQGTLVVVSDGESTCAPPCDAAETIAAGGIQVQALMVGFRISDEGREELECIANALGGTYVDATDGENLAEVFEAASRPTIEVALDHPEEVTAEVGNSRRGLVTVRAKITNGGGLLARNVTARFRFDGSAPGVTRPLRALGNLEPGESREVEWSFRPGLLLVGEPVRFTVLSRAENVLTDGQAAGSVNVVDRADARSAGDILRRSGQIVIMGDSYSSGEGADEYIASTNTDTNKCHRSRWTYLVPQFGIPANHIIACSGAVTNDIGHPNAANQIPAQIKQLDDLLASDPSAVSAIVLTIGGNDAGFGDIGMSCLAMLVDCSERVYPTLVPVGGTPRDEYVANKMRQLVGRLSGSYRAINAVVNSRPRIAARGTGVPIIVLAYPIPLPQQPRASCFTTTLADPPEIATIVDFAVQLNGVVEAEVEVARRDGVPVAFVPNTEDAFLPGHTVCDGDASYARGLETFNGAGFDFRGTFKEGVKDVLYPAWLRPTNNAPAEAVWGAFDRARRELLHPNREGFRALSNAVIRWSNSEEANDLLASLDEVVGPDPVIAMTWPASEVNLGQLAPGDVPVLQGGTSYGLQVGGFAPNSPLTVVGRSVPRVLAAATADENGVLDTRVSVPADMDPGDHRIEVVGVGADGSERIVSIPVEVAGQQRPLLLGGMGLGGILIVAGVLLWLSGRRGTGRVVLRQKPGHGT